MSKPIYSPDKPYVFVLMPFAQAFQDVYCSGIKQAAEESGTFCERVDEQYLPELIVARVYQSIKSADLIIADLSEGNPNVYYEVGYAHALEKPIIHLVRQGSKLPFDLLGFTYIEYINGTELRPKLINRIKEFLASVYRAQGERVTRLERQQEKQASLIQQLQIIVSSLATKFEVDKLRNLSQSSDFLCVYRDELYSELQRLDGLGFIKPTETNGLNAIRAHQGIGEFNLKDYVTITDKGKEFLNLLESLTKQ